MHETAQHLHIPPFSKELPGPIAFRTANMPAHATYPQHSHAWGEFVYAFSGVMEIKLGDRHLLAPPQYGVWLAPNLEHRGLNRQAACHGSLYIAEELCGALPKTCCALVVSPLMRALLDHLRQHAPVLPRPDAVNRLLQVLVDQLTTAACAGSYLPMSEDPLLNPLLLGLEANPGDTRSVAELASLVHTTERTLMRRCQRELGMSLAQWRKRLRVVSSMPRLQSGETVENIAHDLGYSTSSAFISMFRRLMGATPDEYRKGASAS
ncbi:AraC family transcriptional regulator [Thiomonas sp. X19]|uniref:AraC family transcriptional regulator n=1 Tax=Thiomonas sp. X19 TaxID=1050370 RepID=UPI000B633B05|nr:helix-turn-helix transcriptional regulator [Thiomonas sp. X19]SCC92775.1 AraC family transcriptional regulator [Thiomonas sp. X19]